MDKHTPGPWSTYLNTADDMVVRKMFPDGQEAHPIARVQSPNAIRDARLIAAAPDLLEALQKIPQRYMDDMDAHTPRAAQLIRAAIAKATGEATC